MTEFVPKLFGGTTVIRGTVQRLDVADWQHELYRTRPPVLVPVGIQAIPYCLWDNRESGEMRVWIYES